MTYADYETPLAGGLSLRTIQWAMQHDWFVSTTQDGRGVIVEDRAIWKDGRETVEYREFRNRQALRDFAGY